MTIVEDAVGMTHETDLSDPSWQHVFFLVLAIQAIPMTTTIACGIGIVTSSRGIHGPASISRIDHSIFASGNIVRRVVVGIG